MICEKIACRRVRLARVRGTHATLAVEAGVTGNAGAASLRPRFLRRDRGQLRESGGHHLRPDSPDRNSGEGTTVPRNSAEEHERTPRERGSGAPAPEFVRSGRVELPQYYDHQNLNLARLPVPPRPQQGRETRKPASENQGRRVVRCMHAWLADGGAAWWGGAMAGRVGVVSGGGRGRAAVCRSAVLGGRSRAPQCGRRARRRCRGRRSGATSSPRRRRPDVAPDAPRDSFWSVATLTGQPRRRCRAHRPGAVAHHQLANLGEHRIPADSRSTPRTASSAPTANPSTFSRPGDSGRTCRSGRRSRAPG